MDKHCYNKVWNSAELVAKKSFNSTINKERDQLLTIEEVALKLKVPKSWIYERTRSHSIPFRKIGKYLRFQEEEIVQWVNENCPTKFKKK